MKSITIAGERISPLLRKSEAEYITAGYAEKLTDMDEDVALKHLITIVNKSYIEMEKSPGGINPHERKRFVDVFAKLIRNDLIFHFPQLTLKELEIAIRKGIRNQFGPYYGFSVVSIHMFVEKYLESDERRDAMAKQHRFLLMQQTPQEPPAINQWEIMRTGLLQCYNNYCKTRRIIDFGNVNYELLVKAKEIVLSPEEKRFIYNVAEMQVRNEQALQATINRTTYRALQEMKGDPGPVIARSKEIALKNYFDSKPDFDALMDTLYRTFSEGTG